MSAQFKVPTRDEVSETNQAIFDNLQKMVGFVPNLYAIYAWSPTALNDYLTLQNRKSSLKAKEREIINLVTSEENGCRYCQSAHTAVGKMNGFTDEQIIEIRSGHITFDAKFDALAKFTKSVVIHRGKPSKTAIQHFFDAGYTKENLIDTIIVVGDKTISNYLHGVTQLDIDWPVAPELEVAHA